MVAISLGKDDRSIGQLGRHPSTFLGQLLAIADRLDPSRVFRRIQEEARCSATIRELNLLSDYYLDDIGARRSVDRKANDLVNRLRLGG